MKRLSHCLPFLGALGLLGCASFGNFAGTGDVAVVYGVDAADNLARGDKALDAKSYEEAARYYEFVKTKYPYLEVAKTAELKLGDTDFERERFTEARDRYQNFVRLHPTHALVDYAAFRAALTHYRGIPSDFFLLPPSIEKEQVDVKGALVAMSDFVVTYPESKYLAEARAAVADVKRRLAEHEFYVAEFYAKRGRWPAVVGRLSVVTKNYGGGGAGVDERASFGLFEAHQKLNQPAKAAEALQAYLARNPEGEGAAKAKALLASIPLAAAPAPDAAAPAASALDATAPDAGR